MKLVLPIFLLFHFLTCFGGNASRLGIINGRKTDKSMMQYMASLQDSSGDHVCGGFLISEYFVVTAAHCDDEKPKSVVLGTHNLKEIDTTMRYKMKKCKHPDYVKPINGNDIMLLKLSRKARLGKEAIKPIPLPSHAMNITLNMTGHVAGWGLTATGGHSIHDLRDVNVPIVDQATCQSKWNGKLPTNIICAGGYGTKKGFCQGDSGGPLVYKNLAVGVVSFNQDNFCNYPDVPNVYTDLSKFLPWIKKILRKKKCVV